MKLVLVLSLVVLCAVVFQPAEAARTTKKPPGPLTKTAGLAKTAVNYVGNLVKKGWKSLKGLAKSVWKDVEKHIKYLTGKATKVWPAVKDKIKKGATDFKKEITDLKKVAKKLSGVLTDKLHRNLLKVAFFIVSKNTTIEEVARTVEKEVGDIKNMESTILTEILKVPKSNTCVSLCKDRAMAYKANNLKNYANCTANAYDAVKTVGEFLFKSAVTVLPDVMDAALALVRPNPGPDDYSTFSKTLGQIIFTDIPKVYLDGKKQIAKIKEDLENGLKCVIKKFEDAKANWNELSEKLATC